MNGPELSRVLNSEDGAAARGLAQALVRWVWERPLRSVIDVDWVVAAVADALSSPGLAGLLELHMPAVALAELERARAAGEPARVWLPASVADGLAARMGRSFDLPEGWNAQIVDPVFARVVVADALADVLEEFVAQLPLAAAASGLLGTLTRSAGRFNGGEGAMGRRVRAFANTQAGRLRERVVQRFYAPENAKEMAAMAARALDAVLSLPTSELILLAEDPGWETIASWTTETLAAGVARPEIREAIAQQVEAALDRTDASTLGEWLAPCVSTEFEAEVTARLARQLHLFFGSAPFAAWLQTIVDPCTES